MTRSSFVVTGGARGIGAAIVAKLRGEGNHVVVIDVIDGSEVLVGDAGSLAIARMATKQAEAVAPLRGWVNNAALFDDASLHGDPFAALDIVVRNLAPVFVGTSVAVDHLLGFNRAGSIVNISSHQAQRPVAGALPYATAKAAIEGLTRATAVDYGRSGIRANAVALGSIETERMSETVRTAAVDVHAAGRIGQASEVADVVSWLLSDASGFVTGTTIPVDGGRAVFGRDPEERL